MTIDEVREAVDHIAGITHDAEAAHSLEDRLYSALLSSIADGTCDDPQACASEALRAAAVDFPRWCA